MCVQQQACASALSRRCLSHLLPRQRLLLTSAQCNALILCHLPASLPLPPQCLLAVHMCVHVSIYLVVCSKCVIAASV